MGIGASTARKQTVRLSRPPAQVVDSKASKSGSLTSIVDSNSILKCLKHLNQLRDCWSCLTGDKSARKSQDALTQAQWHGYWCQHCAQTDGKPVKTVRQAALHSTLLCSTLHPALYALRRALPYWWCYDSVASRR